MLLRREARLRILQEFAWKKKMTQESICGRMRKVFTQMKGVYTMKKMIPALIAILLILVIAGGVIGKKVYDKYSYSTERADLAEYFGASGEYSAIILGNEKVEEQALVRGGVCYFDIDTVHAYLTETFYEDDAEELLLYTTPTQTIRTSFGASSYTTSAGEQTVDYVICFQEGDTLYIAADYVKQFVAFAYQCYDYRVQLTTDSPEVQIAEIAKDTAIRLRGGVKSEILEDVSAGEQVIVLEEMETWSKVKSADSVIGYVENKRLKNEATAVMDMAAEAVEQEEYTSISMDSKVSLGWHAIGGVGGNDTLYEMVSGTKGMNVIAPTWFSLNDEEGGFRSFASSSYVETAHKMGLQVWGVLDNFNYANETGTALSTYNVLSSTTKRQKLVADIAQTAVSLGLDGINIDFEQLTSDSGVHFVQFLRELSVACRANGLVLSVDNYVPFNFNDYYRLDIQGQVCDYVIIMGYDEHWHGSGDPGSVASIDYVSEGLARTLEEVPAAKVINALPFYTILWKTDNGTVTDEYITMNNQADFISRYGLTPTWDEETCQNYSEWTSGSALYQIWFEDAESIQVKLNVMNTDGIAGVAVWRLGYGTEAAWELINLYVSQ